jgi:hypothetical protein
MPPPDSTECDASLDALLAKGGATKKENTRKVRRYFCGRQMLTKLVQL